MLNSQQLGAIVNEFKAGFQIPPYVNDDTLAQLAKEAYSFMTAINPMFDPVVDVAGRSLLKNRMFYAYNHKENSFQEDYGADLTTWQFDSMEAING